MNLSEYEKSLNSLSPAQARKKLILLLQLAHAGEKAAANAYFGHFKSLFVPNKTEKKEIKDIYLDELHHRKRLNEMLEELSAKPKVYLEMLFFCIGFVIGSLCLFGGWFIPMYGAGKLESTNIVEYEAAARLAYLSGQHHIIDELIEFAEIEWDHELYFRNKAEAHFLYSLFPKWKIPKEKSKIKSDFEKFKSLVAEKSSL